MTIAVGVLITLACVVLGCAGIAGTLVVSDKVLDSDRGGDFVRAFGFVLSIASCLVWLGVVVIGPFAYWQAV